MRALVINNGLRLEKNYPMPVPPQGEALIRVFNDPTAYARRLSARLHATPHRLREILRAPPEACMNMSPTDRTRRLLALSLLVPLLGGVAGARAQGGPGGYPDKPVRLVVPAAPGSLTDPVARVVADEMRRRTGQAWTVDNKPGAGGVIGSGEVARAPADGYTLLFSANNLLISPAMYRNVPYKVTEAFAIERGDPDFLAYLNAWIVFHEDIGWLEQRRNHWFRSLDWMPKP